jgi:histidinol-phosphate aminotransferase
LLQRGIVTRNGDALGMPGRLRITIGTAQQNALVVEALRELVPAHA